MNYKIYLNSPAWRSLRLKILARDRYICQLCGKRKATEVHHLTYERIGRELENDLISLCSICHRILTRTNQKISINTTKK
jgi:5-methylcytosine-specific restriction endonuclease McrA